MYDIKFLNMVNGELFNLTIIKGIMRFKSEFQGLILKNEKVEKKCIRIR